MWYFMRSNRIDTKVFERENSISFAFCGWFVNVIGFDGNEYYWNSIQLNLSSHANDFNKGQNLKLERSEWVACYF